MTKRYLNLLRACIPFFTQLFVFFPLFVPAIAHSEQAKFVKTDSVGGGLFVDVAEVNGIHYFASYEEAYLKVYDLSKQGEDVVLGMIEMPGVVDSIVSWQDMLVVATFKEVNFYQANSTEISLIQHLPFPDAFDSMLAASERYLVHAGGNGHVTVYEKSDNDIRAIGTYVFESGWLDLNRLAIGIEDNAVYLNYVPYSDDGSAPERLIMKLEILSSELVFVDEFSLDYTNTSVNRFSAFASRGRFAYLDHVNSTYLLKIFGEKDGKLGLLETINLPRNVRPTGIAYWQDKLLVTTEDYAVLNYDVSTGITRLESTTQVENPASSLLYPTLFKATESGLYGAATSALFKVNLFEHEVGFDFHFLNAGIEGKAVSVDDFLFVPIDNRIFQYSITSDHKLQLEDILSHSEGFTFL